MKKRPNLSEAKKAIRLWRSEWVSRETQRANARKWLAAVSQLGDRSLLATPVRRVS